MPIVAKLCETCKINTPHYTRVDKGGKLVAKQCKICKAALHTKHYEENKEEYLQRAREQRKNNPIGMAKLKHEYYLRNVDAVKMRSKTWAANNKERVATFNRRSGRVYRLKYPDKLAAKNAMRKAHKIKATPPWLTEDQVGEILAKYTEAKQLTEETGVQHHVDHIVPLRGALVRGLHVPWNLQVLTMYENCSKGNSV